MSDKDDVLMPFPLLTDLARLREVGEALKQVKAAALAEVGVSLKAPRREGSTFATPSASRLLVAKAQAVAFDTFGIAYEWLLFEPEYHRAYLANCPLPGLTFRWEWS